MLLSQRPQPSYASTDGPRAPVLPLRRVLAARSSLGAVGAMVAVALVVSSAALALVVQTAGWRETVVSGMALRAAPMELHHARAPASDTSADVEQLIAALGGSEAMRADAAAVQFVLTYNGKDVTPGELLAPEQAREPPAVRIRPVTTDDARFALVLVDIDAPDPANPAHAPFLHYVVANLSRGDNAPPADARAAPVVVPYFPVSPPMGEHRYVALLLHQSAPPLALARDEAESARLAAHRANFDLVGFARAHALHLVAISTFHSRPAV